MDNYLMVTSGKFEFANKSFNKSMNTILDEDISDLENG